MSRLVYNKTFDPEIWEQVNPRNKELLNDFVLNMKENRRSPGTIRQYGYDLRGFFCHIYRTYENRFVLELTRKELHAYALNLVEAEHLSNARRNSSTEELEGMFGIQMQ